MSPIEKQAAIEATRLTAIVGILVGTLIEGAILNFQLTYLVLLVLVGLAMTWGKLWMSRLDTLRDRARQR